MLKKIQKNRNRIKNSLNMVTLQVLLPRETGKKEEEIRDTKELNSIFGAKAEDFFASIYSTYESSSGMAKHISFEIVAKRGEILFFVACARELVGLLEKQITSFYPQAHVEEVEAEYNIFEIEGKVAATELELLKKYIFPIKTYEELESDSLNVLTNALSKLGEEEAAAIQVVIEPADPKWRIKVLTEAKRIGEGKEVGFGHGTKLAWNTGKFLGGLVGTATGQQQAPEQKELVKLTPNQEQTQKALQEKASKVGFWTNIRIITQAPSETQAQAQLANITSAFAQFNSPLQNSFKRAETKAREVVNNFILKNHASTNNLLTSWELAAVFHFPGKTIETPNIKWLHAKSYSAPAMLPKEGILIGENVYRNEVRQVRLKEDDRRRHVYIIGKTGTGKSTLMKNMILQDIHAGKGVCVVDPHGDLIEGVLGKIPKERAEDVILFDPGDMERPLGLNLFDFKKPEQKDFLVQEAINMLYKLYDPHHQGIMGPRFERWFRNAALLAMSDPEGALFHDVSRIFTNDDFLKYKLQFAKDPIVRSFFEEEMAQTADFHKSEVLGWFTSKFDAFMTNDIMRGVLGQVKSAFDFREVMDSGKILLVNLSKGKVGELNSMLLGMIFVTKIQMAAMSRVDTPEEQRRDFYLYVDEFQNFSTDSFAAILSEARKYRLNLITAHQYIEQLDENVRNAVFGNIGTLFSFTIGPKDAEFLAKFFAPVFNETDLVNIQKYNAYLRLLVDNTALPPFSVETKVDPYPESAEIAASVKQLSRLKYGKEREDVEQGIKDHLEKGKMWREEKERESQKLLSEAFKEEETTDN